MLLSFFVGKKFVVKTAKNQQMSYVVRTFVLHSLKPTERRRGDAW